MAYIDKAKSTMWETPIDFFKMLDDEFHFTTDVCATEENKKCSHFYSPEQDGLKQIWGGCAGATHLMGKRFPIGSERQARANAQPLCLYLQEQIQDGSTITYTENTKSAS